MRARKTDRPNKLYFEKIVGKIGEKNPDGKEEFFWTLRSPNGAIIGSSHSNYRRKNDAIKNAISLFSEEIRAGNHKIVGHEDLELLLIEGSRQGKVLLNTP